MIVDSPTVKRLILEVLAEHPGGMTADVLREHVRQRFLYQLAEDAACDAAAIDQESDIAQVERELNTPYETRLGIEDAVVVGEGQGWVYAYAYPGLEDRLKIGAAAADPVQRIMQQLGTSSPAWPKIIALIKCDDARRLEGLLHRWLKELGRQIDAPGSEWFQATADDVIQLVTRIRTPLHACL